MQDKKKLIIEIVQNMVIFFMMGIAMGFISKYADTVSVDGSLYSIWVHKVSVMTTEIPMWVFLGGLIAITSKKVYLAAMNNFLFFSGMLLSYYLYTYSIYHFIPKKYIMVWVMLTIAATLGSCLIYFAKKKGWVGAIAGGVVTALLLLDAYRIYYLFEFKYIIYSLFVIVFFTLYSYKEKQYLLNGLVAIGIFIILYIMDFYPRLFSILM